MLYHRTTGWQNSFDTESLILIKSAKRLSKHLWNHIDYPDRKHNITADGLFDAIEILQSAIKVEPFEVEVNNDRVEKCVVRIPYDNTYDISIVFRHQIVVTAWLNRKDDTHKTLNTKRYRI